MHGTPRPHATLPIYQACMLKPTPVDEGRWRNQWGACCLLSPVTCNPFPEYLGTRPAGTAEPNEWTLRNTPHSSRSACSEPTPVDKGRWQGQGGVLPPLAGHM